MSIFKLAAIDTGQSGAIAILNVKSRTDISIEAILDMPFVSSKLPHIDTTVIANFIKGCDHVVIESVNPIAGEGTAKSMFRQGGSYFPIGHAVSMAGLDCECTLITPQKWKGILGVQGGTGSKKKKTFDLCCKVLPNDVPLFLGVKGGMLDGRTDAVGIGLAYIKWRIKDEW